MPSQQRRPITSWVALCEAPPAGHGRLFFLSAHTNETASGGLSEVLGFPGQERFTGFTGVSPAKGHEDD